MATPGTENGTKLVWWILGISASVAVLFISFAVNKIDGHDRRIRAIEIIQGENREYIRQHLALLAEMHAHQLENGAKFGEIKTELSLLAAAFHTLNEKLATLQRPRDDSPR